MKKENFFELCINKLKEHHDLIRATGNEIKEVEDFKW